ncbi:hypothetical protein R1sor_018224 [Riccia sorocarpa]|uniref:Uncharacterized protein n=1 Tax=Riccia sorocarpa TaxID=122646 RepID=A0ABD3I981_9MARC
MAVGTLPTGQETLFYDPLYRENVNGYNPDDSLLRYYDDFSVFNYLHLPKPQILSISSPQAAQNRSVTPKSSSLEESESVCDSVPTLSAPPRNKVEIEAAKHENEPNSSTQQHHQKAGENDKTIVEVFCSSAAGAFGVQMVRCFSNCMSRRKRLTSLSLGTRQILG